MPRANGFPALTVRELPVTTDVIAAFESLRSGPYPWLLDSGAAPGAPSLQVARYSFAGCDPYAVLRSFGRRSALSCSRSVAPELPVGEQTLYGDPLEIMRRVLLWQR